MQLPQELLDCIINYLHDSRSTLRASSLVSSSWTDPARRYLFRRLKYVRGPYLVPDYPSLLRFLEATPSIARHVRILDLRGKTYRVDWDKLDSRTFSDLIAMLPCLEDVTLRMIHLLPPPSPAPIIADPTGLSGAVSIPKPLRSLCFQVVRLDGVDSSSALSILCQYLRPISSVQILELDSLGSSCDRDSISNITALYKTLSSSIDLDIETLIVETASFATLLPLEAIRRTPPSRLRNLECSCGGRDGVEILQSLLDDVGTALESVSISFTTKQRMRPRYLSRSETSFFL